MISTYLIETSAILIALASQVLVSVAKVVTSFWAPIQTLSCCTVQGITPPPTSYYLIYQTRRIFRYECYLAISAFSLLSHVVRVGAQLGEDCNIFRLRWDNLGVPPPPPE